MNHLNDMLEEIDPEILEAIEEEAERQEHQIELIASENFVSKAVMEAQGSVFTNKYAEGYPKKRYYSGCENVDVGEQLAIDRITKLFGCSYANVQPHSGSQANQAVYLSILNPGDKILGMALDAGGHLTHGCNVNISGKWFDIAHYGVNDEGLIDYDEVERIALATKPKMIIAGYSAYSRHLDFKRFREIADKVGAYLMADIAHIAGLVVTGHHPSPFPHAHVATSTTHKTLRGPRGGIILANDEELGKKFNSAIFPGLQGGPLMHVIAAKAVAFGEALRPAFKEYIAQVMKNASVMADTLTARGYKILSGGTDNHMFILDLRPQNLTGKVAAHALDEAGITCNKNSVPNDPTSPFVTSGLRFGSPAMTTRGFKETEAELVANIIADILDALQKNPDDIAHASEHSHNTVIELCSRFPMYS